MGQENFPRHAGRGGDGAKKNHAGQGRRPYPSAQPCPAPLPSLVLKLGSNEILIYCFKSNAKATKIFTNILKTVDVTCLT